MILHHSNVSLLLCLLVAVFVSTAALHMEKNGTSLSSNIQNYKTTEKPSPNGDNSSLKKKNLDTIKDKSSKTMDSSSKIADRSAVHSDKSLNDDPGTMKANLMLNDGGPATSGEFKCYVGDYKKETTAEARSHCGYSYTILSGSDNDPICDSAYVLPKNGQDLPNGHNFFAALILSGQTIVFNCACNGSACNEKEGAQECIMTAFASNAIYNAVDNNATLEKIIHCIARDVTLSEIWKVPEVVVTTTLAPPPVVQCACSNSSVDASSNSTSNRSTTSLAATSLAILSVLLRMR